MNNQSLSWLYDARLLAQRVVRDVSQCCTYAATCRSPRTMLESAQYEAQDYYIAACTCQNNSSACLTTMTVCECQNEASKRDWHLVMLVTGHYYHTRCNLNHWNVVSHRSTQSPAERCITN